MLNVGKDQELSFVDDGNERWKAEWQFLIELHILLAWYPIIMPLIFTQMNQKLMSAQKPAHRCF
jgi:hypothetical protein